MTDFYEDADVLSAFESGEKGVTAPPEETAMTEPQDPSVDTTDDATEAVEEIDVPDVPEPDKPEDGEVDPGDTYTEGPDRDET